MEKEINIGNYLKLLRLNSKMTLNDISNKLNYSLQVISKWENNNSYPNIDIIPSLCNLYNASLDDFFNLKTSTYNENINEQSFDIENFSKYFRFFRIKNNYSQGDLADKLDVSKQTILRIEKYKCTPNIQLFIKIANLFNVSYRALFYGDDHIVIEEKRQPNISKIIKIVLISISSVLLVGISVTFLVVYLNIHGKTDSSVIPDYQLSTYGDGLDSNDYSNIFKDSDYSYTINSNNEIEIRVLPISNDGLIYVPKTINSIKVTSICSGAIINKNEVKKFIVAGSITDLGKDLFNDTTNLSYIDLGTSSYVSFTHSLFSGLDNLKFYRGPTYFINLINNDRYYISTLIDSSKPLDYFYYSTISNTIETTACYIAKKIFIPKNVEVLGGNSNGSIINSESYKVPLEEVVFEKDSTCYFMISSFKNCVNLKTFKFPTFIEDIATDSFYNCSSLEYLDFSENKRLVAIEKEAFYNINLKYDLYLPSSVVRYEEKCFEKGFKNNLSIYFYSMPHKLMSHSFYPGSDSSGNIYNIKINFLNNTRLSDDTIYEDWYDANHTTITFKE